MNIKALVFEGGSVKGSAFSGAITYLEENKLLTNVNHFAGSSAGAIVAGALAVGYKSHEIRKIMMETDFSEFKHCNWITKHSKTAQLYSLIHHWGIYDSSYFYEWFGNLMERKTGNKDITFGDIKDRYGNIVVITGTNLTKRATTFFSHTNHRTMPLRLAVRISMSIPLFFKPVIFEKELYVDGGLLTNYPIQVFDYQIDPKYVIGFNLLSGDESPNRTLFNGSDEINNILQLIKSIALSCHTQIERLHISSGDWKRTVPINTEDVSGADFNISKSVKNRLYSEGYMSTKKFIENRHLTFY